MIWYPMTEQPEPRACASHACLKVFTCRGMQDATRHFREPLLVLGGLIFGLLGLHGAVGINHSHLKSFAYFQLFVTVMYIALIVFDAIFLNLCDHYPSNCIHQMIYSGVEDWPIQEDKKQNLRDMHEYPYKLVNWMVDHNVWRWYVISSVIYALISLYFSHETMILSRIYTDGPCGLGVNYRLGAWRAEVLLKHKIEEMEEEIIFGKTLREDVGLNELNKKAAEAAVEHLPAEPRKNYGAV